MSDSDFFQVGGNLDPHIGSYVNRPADDKLFTQIQTNRYCYILASRQMGKSSLMIRTADRLKKHGVRTVMMDLNQLGVTGVSQESWCYSFLNQLVKQCRLSVNLRIWWAERNNNTFIDRFASFLQEVVLIEIESQVVIFIDEIDTTLKLDFSDDFFAAIRTLYNHRAESPELSRLVFVLIGVASPSELIKDPSRTPFNVGQRVEMTDFTLNEAATLTNGFKLPPDKASQVLGWVHQWTGGHPYLTQRLCREISNDPRTRWAKLDVDHLVEDIFLSKKGEDDSNLAFVRDWLTNEGRGVDTVEVLSFYGDILLASIPDDETSEIISYLKLSGIVRRDNQGILRLRNRIYEKVFDRNWFDELEAIANAGGSRALARQRKLIETLEQQAGAERRRAEEAEQRAEAEKRQARAERQRVVWLAVAGTVAILLAILAIVLGVWAVVQTSKAKEQARNSLSRQLAAQASNHSNDLDLALLLGLEANQLTDLPEVKGGLLAVLQQSNPHLIRFLHGHNDQVTTVALSPDGETLASGSHDRTIMLWDAATGNPIGQPLTGHEGKVESVTFSPDGQTLASSDHDGQIILWNMDTKQAIKKLNMGGSILVHSVAFSPDGQILASGGSDNKIILWDVVTGQPIGQPLTDHKGEVESVVFSPDGQIVASGSQDKSIILWDVTTGQPIGQPLTDDSTAELRSLAFSPDGKIVASGDTEGRVFLWDVKTGNPVDEFLHSRNAAIESVTFSPDGRRLVSASRDRSVILWGLETGEKRGQTFVGHTGPVRSVAFSPDGLRLVSGGEDQTIILWDVDAQQRFGRTLSGGHEDQIESVAFSPDGAVLASGSFDGTIMLWNVETGQQRFQKPIEGHANRGVAFSPDGKTLASGDTENRVLLWDLEDQSIDKYLDGHKQSIKSVAFSPDGKMLASSSENGTIILWNLAEEEISSKILVGHKNGVENIAFSPNGKMLASGGWDANIILWELTTSHPISWTLQGHEGWVHSVTFSPDGKMLASGAADNPHHIILWDVDAHKRIGSFVGHTNEVDSVAFSPDGKMLASSDRDSLIFLWDVNTRQAIGQLRIDHKDGAAWSVAFSPDGQTLASGGRDGRIVLWDVNFESWQTRACSIANRSLTEEEWKQFVGLDIPYRQTCSR